MYSPKIEPGQIEKLYRLRERLRKQGQKATMTGLVREMIDEGLKKQKANGLDAAICPECGGSWVDGICVNCERMNE